MILNQEQSTVESRVLRNLTVVVVVLSFPPSEVCVCVFSLGLVVVVVGVAAAGAACSAALMPHDDGHDRHEGLGEHRHQCANHVYLRKREEQEQCGIVQEGSGVDDGNALPIAAGAAGAVVAAAGGEVVVGVEVGNIDLGAGKRPENGSRSWGRFGDVGLGDDAQVGGRRCKEAAGLSERVGARVPVRE